MAPLWRDGHHVSRRLGGLRNPVDRLTGTRRDSHGRVSAQRRRDLTDGGGTHAQMTTDGTAGSPRGPLSGLLVADFSRILAGPYATMLLADLGA